MKRFTLLFIVLSISLTTSPLPAQTLEELQKKLSAHTQELSPDLGKKRLPKEEVETAKVAFETAREILSKNITEEFRIWTLKRKAAALIILAHEETAQYLPELLAVVEELDGVKTCEAIMAEAERHVLSISTDLVVQPIEGKGGKKLAIAVKPLAQRMVLFAKTNPGQESDAILQHFLRKLSEPTARRETRDKRLAEAIPVIADYYEALNTRESRNYSSYLRCTQRRLELPGNTMLLTGFDLDGQIFNADSLKDRVVLVQFWGTWCKPCLQEMPHLIELYNKYHAQGFEILGYNTAVRGDERPQTVKNFVTTTDFGDGKKITWPVLHEGVAKTNKMEPITHYYGIEELPVLVLIGRNGKVIALNPSSNTLEMLIHDALAHVSLDDLTEEERAKASAARKKQDEELDRQIQRELETIQKKN